MLQEITVKKTLDPDKGYTDKEQLLRDIYQHREDVSKLMNMFAMHLITCGENHDWTKIDFFEDFSNDTLERLTTPEFKERDWYQIHCTYERHHLNAKAPDDVDLADVLEMICDCLVAGVTRNGSFNPYFLILRDGLLEKAYWNTVQKLKDLIIVAE